VTEDSIYPGKVHKDDKSMENWEHKRAIKELRNNGTGL